MKKRHVSSPTTACLSILIVLARVCCAASAMAEVGARQWQVMELVFVSGVNYSDPFDFEHVRFSAEFEGPDGTRLTVPGFWDGVRTWKVRFTPTIPGKWTYSTRCTNIADGGLQGKHGNIDVAPPSGETPLRAHGGFLAVSSDHRYLTYTDGTPFFWLADTWWRVPSSFVPFDDFKRMVDVRLKQGFTVFQAHGHTGFSSNPNVDVFEAMRVGGDTALVFWQEVDRYMAYAERGGILAVVGFAGINVLDAISGFDLKRLWLYYLARYGAYPITFLITQEYNAEIGKKQERIAKLLDLGRFIRANDPYKRAMSIHPWVRSRDGQEAWSEEWYDFVMIQSGHFRMPSCEAYLRAYDESPRRPILESELNYEGFERDGFRVTASVIRDSAYTAIQCGSMGFSYGAQGLYAGVSKRDVPGPTAKWGPILTWGEGLALEGGRELAHLRTLYESVDWWRLTPWPVDKQRGDLIVKAAGDSTIVIYIRGKEQSRGSLSIYGLPLGSRYDLMWFDPRTGKALPRADLVEVRDGELALGDAPSAEDWVVVARASAGKGQR